MSERVNRAVIARMGEPCTVTPEGGETRQVRALFALERGDGSGPATGGRPDPRITARAEDLPPLEAGATVSARGRTYALVRPEEDDGGMITLHLRERRS